MIPQAPQLPRLGVNIDHVATLRQLRGTPYPSVLEAASLALGAGARQITVHLRGDRRHIQPADVLVLARAVPKLGGVLNLEMAATPAMLRFALKTRPAWVCLVPEKREEVTTEGGLNLARGGAALGRTVAALRRARIRVSLFVEPTLQAVKHSVAVGADAVEFHTGRYCIETQRAPRPNSSKVERERDRLVTAAIAAHASGLHAHAGHGLDYDNVRELAQMVLPSREPLFEEYNIGHAIVCRAAIVGMERAVREMVSAIVAP